MDSEILSLAHLETLSSSDLLLLAEDFGIDIPDDLDRNFVIGEILEAAQDSDLYDEAINLLDEDVDEQKTLPESYNVTMIDVVLRNPVWAFVYWDLKKTDIEYAHEHAAQMLLRVSFYSSDGGAAEESFDVSLKLSDRQQYILIPAGKEVMRIDLVFESDLETITIASTRFVQLPHGCKELNDVQPGRDEEMTEILKLSGMENMLKEHFVNHRQSFS